MDASQFRTIDWVFDAQEQNRIRLARSQNRFSWGYFVQAANSWLIHASSGAVIGTIAVLLTLSTGWLVDLREGHCSTLWYLNESTCCLNQNGESCSEWVPHPWYAAYFIYIILSASFAVTASFLVTRLAPLAAGSGISEIKCIISGFYASSFLSWITLVVKCIALPLTIASGLSVGKEGPSVHYAACVGHVVSSLFGRQDYRKRSDILTACCAAGVAVAFGSPMGGLLFGLEEMAAEISLNTIWRSYFCCLVATSVVSLFNPFRTGQLVLFSVQYDSSWHAFDLPFFMLLGVCGGFVGHFIVKYNLRITALRKRYWGANHVLIEAFILAFLTAVVCYFNTYLRVDMTKSMQTLFHECEHGGELHTSCDASRKIATLFSLAVACFVRLLLLLVSYGAAKVPAGIFVPSLATGALLGRWLGTFVWLLHDNYPNSWYFKHCNEADGSTCVNPGAYALLGAGSLLAGVMHISLTVVVVMFELTGALHYVVPTMIVVGMTRFVTSKLGGLGIADKAIRQNNYPFLEREEPPEETEFKHMDAASVMLPASLCITLDWDNLTRPTQGERYRTYPVVDEDGMLVAAVSSHGKDESPITVPPKEPLENVYALFARLGPHTIYVTEKGTFVGLITRKMMCEVHRSPAVEFSPLETIVGENLAKFYDTLSRQCCSLLSKLRRS